MAGPSVFALNPQALWPLLVATLAMMAVLLLLEWRWRVQGDVATSHKLTVAAVCLLVPCGVALAAARASTTSDLDLARILPTGFTVVQQNGRDWQEEQLSGSAQKERVVVSRGPANKRNSAWPADLQVLHWNEDMRAWQVAFDAAKVAPPGGEGPAILPRAGYDSVTYFTTQLGTLGTEDVTQGEDLVILTRGIFGDAGMSIGILDYRHGSLGLRFWRSDLGPITATPLDGGIEIGAEWLTPGHPNCCPLRRYKTLVDLNEAGTWVESDDRPYLGVRLALTPTTTTVTAVETGSPAEGYLQPGDVLLAVDGVVDSPSPDEGYAFTDAIGVHTQGNVVRITFDRNGVVGDASITLQSLVIDDNAPANERTSLDLQAVNSSERDAAVSGAYVSAVDDGGVAQRAGLSEGDVIVAVNGRKVTSESDLSRAMAASLTIGRASIEMEYVDGTGHHQSAAVRIDDDSRM